MPEWAILLATAVGAGGIVGAIAQLRKSKPEATRIVVDAAEGAVVVQTGVIDSLRAELDRAWRLADKLRAELAEVGDLRDRVAEMSDQLGRVERERDRYRQERDDLRGRVELLETEVETLKNGGR
jgi:predicted nuclease with TOPRIM domain